MMVCRRERAVDELYNATQIVMNQRHITSVLRGSHCMKGPADETDHDIHKNMVSSLSRKEFGKHSMSQKVHMRGKSRACNVCSAPCSSCMHLKRALMGSKADEFSDETCRVNVASQYSINVGDTSSSFKSKAGDSLQHTTSDTSNLLSVNSSHDSLSENAESKAPFRFSDTSDALEGVEMLPNKYEDSKVVEAHDDNISCVSRANDANLAVSNHNRSVERKSLPCSSASVGSVGPEKIGKADKSVLLEVLPLKDVDAGSSIPKEKLQECSGHMDSSLTKEKAFDIVAGQKFVSYKGSEFSTKICPQPELETNDDGQDPNDEALKCSDHGEQDARSSELVEVADMQPLQSVSGDDSDESDIVEHDVKVCDICGDAGREDMLATCSRCSDGAEHIYCMRKMLRRVPKGEWLCEECKLAEETDNQKHGSDVEGKRTNKISNKRLAENIEVAPAAKRQAVEARVGSPKSSSPKRTVALSRESSFKSIDKDRLRSAYQTSQSTNGIAEAARCPSTGPRLQTTKGTLLKSNSFSTLNSKAKVKLVDDVVPQKHKGSKEHTSLDMKERAARMMGKSVSFKSANSGRPNVSESKVKMLSSKFTHVQDLKGLKQAKERSTIERKNLSKLDRPVVSLATAGSIVSTPKIDQASRGDTSLLSSVSNIREPKVVLSDVKLSTSKSMSSLTRKGVETQITSAGALTTKGMCSSAFEQKPNQVSSKEEPHSSYAWTVEKPPTEVDGTLEDVLPRSREMTNQADKTRESTVRCRPAVTASPKSVFCQKCKEVGHTAELCKNGISQAFGTDASAPRSSKEEMLRGNRLKDAIHAALLKKPEIYRKKRVLDQSDELSTSNMDLSSDVASEDQSFVSNKLNTVLCVEGSHDGQAIPGSSTSDSYKNTTFNNVKQLTVQPFDSVFPSKGADSVSLVPSLGNPTIKDLQRHASVAMPVLVKTTTIPEYEYIWQGSFEVHRGGNFLDLCGGIQAHLSTCASPQVHEVVNKFPHKVPLNEVPRFSVWPRQFYQSGAKEDNIALYFFAKDLESYERNYKSLLDAMIKNDLALKGNLDGVELLIFPSSQLPEKSQRWNMLFFLWGVFRTVRVHCLDSSKKIYAPSLSDVSLSKEIPEIPAVKTSSDNLPNHIDECSASYRSSNVASASNAPGHMGPTVSKDHENKGTSLEEMCLGSKVNLVLQDSRLHPKYKTNNAGFSEGVKCTTSTLQEICLQEKLGTELKSSIPTAGENSSNKGEKMQMHWVTSFDRKDADSLKIHHVANQEVDPAGGVGEETIPDRKNRAGVTRGGVEEVILDRVNIRDKFKQERELKRDGGYKETEAALVKDLTTRVKSCQSNNRKHPNIDLSETATSATRGQEMPWNEVNSTQIDGENDSKKPKICSSGLYGCSTSATSRGTNAVLHNSSVEEKRCLEACDEKVIPEDLGTTERYFFPVGSPHVQEMDGNSVMWKNFSAGNGDKSHEGFPSLELALGGETKPQNKGILPFFVGLADEKDNQDKPLDKVINEKEDDVSASLSLSLSFPFPDKDQPVKPVSKTEQLLPERHHVNTSLLLFGRFPDK